MNLLLNTSKILKRKTVLRMTCPQKWNNGGEKIWRKINGLSRAFWRKKKIIKRLLWSGLGHDKHVRTFRLLCFTSLSLVNCRGVIRCGPTSPIISSRHNSSSRRRRTSGIWFYKTRKKKICTTKFQRKGILYIYGWTNCAYSEQTPLVYLLVSLPALIPRKLNYVARIYGFKKKIKIQNCMVTK